VLSAVQPYHDVLLVLVFVLRTVCQNLFDGKDKALLGLDLGLRHTVWARTIHILKAPWFYQIVERAHIT
jgi:hypothetical protein